MRCPTCDSPRPHLHPAMALGGECEPCIDPFHDAAAPHTRDAALVAYIEEKRAKRALGKRSGFVG